jgi:hypothetical protein
VLPVPAEWCQTSGEEGKGEGVEGSGPAVIGILGGPEPVAACSGPPEAWPSRDRTSNLPKGWIEKDAHLPACAAV